MGNPLAMENGLVYEPYPSTLPSISSHTRPHSHACRICGEGDDERANPLIRPCLCKGTMSHVHLECLDQWRMLSPRSDSFCACDVCHYRYHLYRPTYAVFLSSPYLIRSVSLMLVVALALTLAYVSQWIDSHCLGHPPEPDSPEWTAFHGPVYFGLDRVYAMAGLVELSLLGLVYFVWLGRTSPLCCDFSSCPWCSCYCPDIHHYSGDNALSGFLMIVTVVLLAILTYGLVGIVTGAYRCVERGVEYAVGRVKERILEVRD